MKVNPTENERFSTHFLLSKEDVKDYVRSVLRAFGPEDQLSVEEIGDGNINYVFRVVDETTNESLIIKQADQYLRSSGRPLAIDRNRIEAEILAIQNELAPNYVPKVYYYDKKMSALTMEDISSYKNMRYELLEKKVFPSFSQQISDYLVKTLLLTSDVVMDRQLKKERVKSFINPEMCDISEDLVFTEPYDDYKGRNILTPGNEQFVKDNLYDNEPLKAEVAYLRNRFMNNAQSLIHGDLHTGSIFVQEKGTKVIDPEFAFYGPAGYDIGNVLAHLYFPLIKNLLDEQVDGAFHEWLKETIAQVYDFVRARFTEAYDQRVTCSLYMNHAFKESFIQSILSDAVGYAGTEIIRRVVGDSKVSELSKIRPEEKIQAERQLLRLGIQLIITREQITNGQQLIEGIEEIEGE